MLLNSGVLNSAVVNGASGQVLLNSSVSCSAIATSNVSITKPIATNVVAESTAIGTMIYLRMLESAVSINTIPTASLSLSKFLGGSLSAVAVINAVFQKINFSSAEDFSPKTQLIGDDLYMNVQPYPISAEVELIDLSINQ